MAGNLGIGIGSFLDGLTRGASAYSNIQEQKSRQKVRDAQLAQLEQDTADKNQYRTIVRDGAQAANTARQADIQSAVASGATPDQAESQVGSYLDYWKKTTAPQLTQHWMETGQVDKAQNFDKWLQDSNVQAGMKSWANMSRSFAMGDRAGFLKNLNATLTQSGYYDGNVQPLAATEKLNDKGQLVGYTVTFKDKATGKESSQDFDGNDIQRMAVIGLSPQQIYSQGMDELAAARKAQAENAKTQRDQNFKREEWGVKQQQTLEAQNNNSQLKIAEEAEKKRLGLVDPAKDPMAKAKATAEWLRSQGYDDAYIRKAAPALVGIQNQSKPMSSRIEDFIKTRIENDRQFSKLPLAKQIEQAQQYIATVDGASGDNTAPAQTTQQPQNQQQQPQSRSVLLWDNKTGQMITR